jgi:1-acyl-sn-glycerol-3-phosphate acyltransferase
MSFLRSILFSTPLIGLSTIVLGLVSMVCSFFDRSGDTAHKVARFWGWTLTAVSFIRVRVVGLEKLDPRANYVFVSNHGSYMDIPAILSRLPYQFRFFAKKGLFQIPFLGWHLGWAGHLPVDRGNARASLKSMSEGARLIARAHVSMLLFPEAPSTSPLRRVCRWSPWRWWVCATSCPTAPRTSAPAKLRSALATPSRPPASPSPGAKP